MKNKLGDIIEVIMVTLMIIAIIIFCCWEVSKFANNQSDTYKQRIKTFNELCQNNSLTLAENSFYYECLKTNGSIIEKRYVILGGSHTGYFLQEKK